MEYIQELTRTASALIEHEESGQHRVQQDLQSSRQETPCSRRRRRGRWSNGTLHPPKVYEPNLGIHQETQHRKHRIRRNPATAPTKDSKPLRSEVRLFYFSTWLQVEESRTRSVCKPPGSSSKPAPATTKIVSCVRRERSGRSKRWRRDREKTRQAAGYGL